MMLKREEQSNELLKLQKRSLNKTLALNSISRLFLTCSDNLKIGHLKVFSGDLLGLDCTDH